MAAKDILDRTLRPSQLVAYPVQTTQGLGMSVAEVTDVNEGCIRLRTQRRDGIPYCFNFTRLDRVVIVEGAD